MCIRDRLGVGWELIFLKNVLKHPVDIHIVIPVSQHLIAVRRKAFVRSSSAADRAQIAVFVLMITVGGSQL